MDAEPDTAEGDELDVLADLVEFYEHKHFPMGYPSPIDAIRARGARRALTGARLAGRVKDPREMITPLEALQARR